MKKILIAFGFVLSFSTTVYAGKFCCPPDKTPEQCCAERGKMYCENDGKCRTRCRDVTPPECIGGCINPDGECCLWCPTAEVCAEMGKCQKIVNGCYDCVECPEPNPCTEKQCMNEEGTCCNSCPRSCPEGQCLTKVDGCYVCGQCPVPPAPVDKCEGVICENCGVCNSETGVCEGGCANGKVCEAGVCVCSSGMTECGSSCCSSGCNADQTGCLEGEEACLNGFEKCLAETSKSSGFYAGKTCFFGSLSKECLNCCSSNGTEQKTSAYGIPYYAGTSGDLYACYIGVKDSEGLTYAGIYGGACVE